MINDLFIDCVMCSCWTKASITIIFEGVSNIYFVVSVLQYYKSLLEQPLWLHMWCCVLPVLFIDGHGMLKSVLRRSRRCRNACAGMWPWCGVFVWPLRLYPVYWPLKRQCGHSSSTKTYILGTLRWTEEIIHNWKPSSLLSPRLMICSPPSL